MSAANANVFPVHLLFTGPQLSGLGNGSAYEHYRASRYLAVETVALSCHLSCGSIYTAKLQPRDRHRAAEAERCAADAGGCRRPARFSRARRMSRRSHPY